MFCVFISYLRFELLVECHYEFSASAPRADTKFVVKSIASASTPNWYAKISRITSNSALPENQMAVGVLVGEPTAISPALGWQELCCELMAKVD